MTTGKNDRSAVEGWKEIAGYFGKSIRAVQEWEAEGLKINRFRNRVWAYEDDLREFKQDRSSIPQDRAKNAGGEAVEARIEGPSYLSAGSPNVLEDTQPPTQHARKVFRRYVPIGLSAVATLALVMFLTHPHQAGIPARCELLVNTLVVKDRAGQELFRHQFPHAIAAMEDTWFARLWAVGDIDGDGETELVFAYQMAVLPETLLEDANEVLCFSPRGKIKWRFAPGRPQVTTKGGRNYFPPYWIGAIKLLKGEGAGSPKLAVSSFHHMEYPNQLAVLDGRGKLLGEYWHPGWLRLVSSADLDHSGHEKLLLAGVNNGQRSATLIVLDPKRVAGAGAAGEESSLGFTGFQRGTEEKIVFFPRTCVSGLGPHEIRYNMAEELRVTKERLFVAVSEALGSGDIPEITYELDYNLNVVSVKPNIMFGWKHAELEKQGVLKHPFNQKDLQDIAMRVAVRKIINVSQK